MISIRMAVVQASVGRVDAGASQIASAAITDRAKAM